ncbi:hypothetical protein PoB_004138700 [Plakobranchus ocellatus]|uniref:Uncharacterized protein n=1 Tax=Plakobranchus ocellatus TaxID=259542 RepID=A0AAV4B705_9GAST|nr:hypothetical protein PoB_004138700 [Plakobranchus ocellatus]
MATLGQLAEQGTAVVTLHRMQAAFRGNTKGKPGASGASETSPWFDFGTKTSGLSFELLLTTGLLSSKKSTFTTGLMWYQQV